MKGSEVTACQKPLQNGAYLAAVFTSQPWHTRRSASLGSVKVEFQVDGRIICRHWADIFLVPALFVSNIYALCMLYVWRQSHVVTNGVHIRFFCKYCICWYDKPWEVYIVWCCECCWLKTCQWRACKVEMCMGMGFPMEMGISWEWK